MTWTVIESDCVSAMRAMDEASVDAVVTDPPYGLEFMGKEWDRLDGPQWGTNAERWGERPKGGTDPFERPRPRYGTSSKQMQDWHQAWATEALRVLKPGGHLLAFGGTRTYHRLACAIEDAGFEIRDSVMWLYGSGFPKSLNLGKAIDARPGVRHHHEFAAHLAERRTAVGLSRADVSERVVGSRSGACWNWEHHQFPEAKWWPALRNLLSLDAKWSDVIAEAERARIARTESSYGYQPDGERWTEEHWQTAPATPDAQKWQGYGTALKPAHEPIVVARKPLIGTVAANVTTFGTGALNIDATRVKGEPWKAHRATGLGSVKFFTEGETPEIDKVPHTSGRWPANLLLSHTEDCEPVGVRKVKGDGHFPKHKPTLGDGEKYGTAKPFDQTERHMADPDGTETVEAWRCAEGCPVAELDRQSGTLKSNSGEPFTRNTDKHQNAYGAFEGRRVEAGYYGDSGGASRFFPTFRYQAKASRAERNAGLEGFPLGEGTMRNASGRPLNPRCETTGRRVQDCDCEPTCAWEKPEPAARNTHPTVKPLALMRWLVRLVTPPEGMVLDPFAGSGTTGAACVLENFDFMGIECEPEYVEIARARIAHWEREANRRPLQLDLEDVA